ncbi:glucosamine-6-phosphate deaminase [Liquorilactobacillus satsumensis]|uniref:Glucosamine-6-phosphate deaminase n=1 Tax=Liquorilactobacillus satsumensis DSM 16230 = JCM 12392 TaxID=1423801 RepID=A0A0R1V2Y8_9LACO|nr:glucosamine-6-phosphate deaminase [Liquorilactobacillus satsumensis]KRM00062.1 glucosamine-6-phosphate isomerase [Liquorilactobacillus satsumensis DSM 16230 = JCM 12392]MCP9329577.1 glucosamine-6-phosphate deaminase [Liquorilactobacillus satsumensis]
MKLIVVKDSEQGGKEAYQIFAEALKNGATVFGLATGSTPLTTYQKLVASKLDFSDAISINLDEYVGLKPDNPQSYQYFMQEHLFKSKPFKRSYLPQGDAKDAAQEVKRYDRVIAENPIDLQLLGIGRNGHIGFNEPGSDFTSATHKVALTPSTIAANARFFKNKDEVPRYAYSMGIGTILKSKKIILEAFGAAKAAAVAAMIEGPVTPACPASALQKHADVVAIVDEAAAAKLKK